MAITDEQAVSIKEQILKQVTSFPEDKREQITEYIRTMNNEQLEAFLAKNKLLKKEGESQETEEKEQETSSKNENCVYCMLSSKKIESSAIYEDKDYLAVLEIRPMSKGHIVLIPKKHIKETKNLKSKAFTIADKIGKHLVKQLAAENFQISSSDELKHAVINIVPAYKGQELDYKRPQKTPKELQELAVKIGAIKKSEKKPPVKKSKPAEKQKQEVKSNIITLPRRIP